MGLTNDMIEFGNRIFSIAGEIPECGLAIVDRVLIQFEPEYGKIYISEDDEELKKINFLNFSVIVNALLNAFNKEYQLDSSAIKRILNDAIDDDFLQMLLGEGYKIGRLKINYLNRKNTSSDDEGDIE